LLYIFVFITHLYHIVRPTHIYTRTHTITNLQSYMPVCI